MTEVGMPEDRGPGYAGGDASEFAAVVGAAREAYRARELGVARFLEELDREIARGVGDGPGGVPVLVGVLDDAPPPPEVRSPAAALPGVSGPHHGSGDRTVQSPSYPVRSLSVWRRLWRGRSWWARRQARRR